VFCAQVRHTRAHEERANGEADEDAEGKGEGDKKKKISRVFRYAFMLPHNNNATALMFAIGYQELYNTALTEVPCLAPRNVSWALCSLTHPAAPPCAKLRALWRSPRFGRRQQHLSLLDFEVLLNLEVLLNHAAYTHPASVASGSVVMHVNGSAWDGPCLYAALNSLNLRSFGQFLEGGFWTLGSQRRGGTQCAQLAAVLRARTEYCGLEPSMEFGFQLR